MYPYVFNVCIRSSSYKTEVTCSVLLVRKIMEPLWPVLLFAAVHIFIVINVASVNSGLT